MKRRYIYFAKKATSVLVVTACLAMPLTGCGQTAEAAETEEEESDSIPVEVQMPKAGSLTLKNEFVGTVSPQESVYVVPLVSAEVLNADIKVGDTVTAGQELCKLDPEAAELQLASAQAQYNSAAAGVQAAEVGYEIAQAQYDSTVAQLDVQNQQTQRQKDLTMYQMDMQIDQIRDGIDDINDQIADLEEDREDLIDQKEELNSARKQANQYVEQAEAAYSAAASAYNYSDMKRNYSAAVATVTAMESPDFDKAQVGGESGYNTALEAAKKDLDQAREALTAVEDVMKPYEESLQAARSTASQMSSAYEQTKDGFKQLDDGKAKLEESRDDTYETLGETETVKNLTEAQLDIDTTPVQEAGKRTAALGVDSAAAQVNSAKVGAAGAKVGIDSAEYQLDMYTLTAPIDGVIEAVNVEAHDYASPGNPAFVISNKDTMTVTFGVSEGIRSTLKVGQKIEVDRNGKIYSAAITEIGSMIDQTTGLFTIKSCVSTPDDSLLTGSTVKVTADTYSKSGVLLIPYDAVYYDNSQPYVYVAEGDVARRRDIETDIFDEQTITVVSGLTEEDRLITSWSANLRDGASISAQEVQEPEGDGAAAAEE